MRRIKQAKPSAALVVAVIALVAAMTGTGVAVTALNSQEKQQVKKIAKQQARKQADKAVKDIPAGPEGPAGPKGDQGLTGPAGAARAYGRVSDDGSLTRSKNVAAVTHPDIGIYCIALTGDIDPDTAVLVVGPDSADNETSNGGDDESYVEWNSEGTDCPAGALEVFTNLYDGDSVDDDDGGGNTTGDNLTSDDESFAFFVP